MDGLPPEIVQLIGYCASPTLGWNPDKGPIEQYVWTADERLVRAALAAVIGQAQRIRDDLV